MLTPEDSNLHHCRRVSSVSSCLIAGDGRQLCRMRTTRLPILVAAFSWDSLTTRWDSDSSPPSPSHFQCTYHVSSWGKSVKVRVSPLLIFCLARAAVLRPSRRQTPPGSTRIPSGLCGLPGFQGEPSISPGEEPALCIFLISHLYHWTSGDARRRV